MGIAHQFVEWWAVPTLQEHRTEEERSRRMSDFPPLKSLDPKRVEELSADASVDGPGYQPRPWEYLRDLLVLACLVGGAALIWWYVNQ